MKKRAFGKRYQELFYIPKHEKLPDKVFRCRMVLSLLTILGCTAVMVSSAFALFRVDISTENSTIKSAYYTVTVNDAGMNTYTCPLAYDDWHTFEIKADGTATTGYCEITADGEAYYTGQIPTGESLTVYIQAARGTEIGFEAFWGVNPDSRSTFRMDDGEIYIAVSETPYETYTVEPTAKLADIANHYGVSESDILLYNNLDATSDLTVGLDLKIPEPNTVEPYRVPYATYTVEPTASLYSIANHYGVSKDDILTYNGITGIYKGLCLKIPGVDSSVRPYRVPYAVYVVEENATIEAISSHYGVSASDIWYYNGIRELTVGQILYIPGVSYSHTPYVAPVPEPPPVVEETEESQLPNEDSDSPATEDAPEDIDAETGDQSTDEQPAPEPIEEQPTEETLSTEDTIPYNDPGTDEQSAEEPASAVEDTSSEDETNE